MIKVEWAASADESAGPSTWAAARLSEALASRAAVDHWVVDVIICTPGSDRWPELIREAKAPAHMPSEAFAIANRRTAAGSVEVLVGAADDRGLTYALRDIADVVELADDLPAATDQIRTRYEQPHVPLRSVTRLYASHRFDHGWLHDRSFWDDYLTELVTHRYNRFTLAFGLGYDYLIDKRVVDNELCFLYPFVLNVPGYSVRVAGLDELQRQANLAALQYAARAATERGLEFGLGLWNHAPRLEPRDTTERWLIDGLSESDHAQYCADAIALLLTEIPDVTTLTFRVHFEGGVPEPTHAFWRAVMSGVSRVDREITVDAHAKGINDELLDALRSAGSPLNLSTKYWGEHMGLPYHQAGIREKEFSGHLRRRRAASESGGSSGADVTRQRSFTRYGYADFARTDAEYGLVHRIWPGTQRVLSTPDPVTAAGIGRHAVFAGARGVEWFDALTFFGKKDSAEHPLPGAPIQERGLYANPALQLTGSETWQKFVPALRVNGRSAYDPARHPDVLSRWFRAHFGSAAADVQAACAHAARVLPLITTVHAPSVAGNIYWPEMDTPLPLIEFVPETNNPFTDRGWHLDPSFDMDPPYSFGNTSPLDPELFASPEEYAEALLRGEPFGKYTPIEVAEWLTTLAKIINRNVEAARATTCPESVADGAQLERMLIDAEIAGGLGAFFADKLRAAVHWSLHRRTSSADQLEMCLHHYRSARGHWAAMAVMGSAYRDDLPFGQMPYQRGHWRDRLPGIDADLEKVAAHRDMCTCDPSSAGTATPWESFDIELTHNPPASVIAGAPLSVTASVSERGVQVLLRYREIDQSRRWSEIPMHVSGPDELKRCAEIPGEAISGSYGLQYRFVAHRPRNGERPAAVGLSPSIDPVRLDQRPYHVVIPR